MSVEHVEVLVEEPSMEAALSLLLPRLLGDSSFTVYSHQCKEQLLASLPGRLRGYGSWLPGNWWILVIVDRDDDDCGALKANLDKMARDAGFITGLGVQSGCRRVVNRIAIEELEAWYFGDWEAVLAAYPRVSASVPGRSRFRDPDGIRGTWEALERIMQRAGYFKGGLRKIEAAREIARHWEPVRNRSRSFRAFYDAVQKMAE
jgi:hypothetical protein